MKILLDYKIGWYARFRKLKILISEDILSEGSCLTEIKQGDRKEVEIPENIPEEHEMYEYRGTTQDVTTCEQVEVLDNQIEDAYVIIKMAALHLVDFVKGSTPGLKHFNIMYRINIYENKDIRNEDVYDALLEVDSDLLHIDDIDAEDLNGTNLLAYCYNHLKQQRGYEDLIND